MTSVLTINFIRKGIISNLYFVFGLSALAYGNPNTWIWLFVLPFLINVTFHNKLLSLFLGMVMFIVSTFFMLALISDLVHKSPPMEFYVGGILFVVLNFVMSGWLVKDAKVD